MSKEMTEALAELDAANAGLKSASEREREASRVETNARNRVNDAQKKLEALVEGLKKTAAWNTKWHSDRNRGVPVGESTR